MTPERERLAEALTIERLHGDGAELYIAERIGALALTGDTVGVARFRAIAAALDRLRRPPARSS
ncbi:hypothetical protein F9288_12945 [Sphingomonas sp. CL5.1]|nr:hypothetical protein F9288_12945 [Sphingomonas sp. CL5.1]